MLEVAGIHTFYGRAHILHGVSLAVGAREVVALLGRNGAGKSTTIRSIMGLARPARGTVTFEGRTITGWAPYRVSRLGIGYVPEDRRVFRALTVRENLAVGQREAADGPAFTIDALFDLFPNLAEREHTAAGRLSGGEQQMLTLARTLMGRPRLVLLDEPSEGIAPRIVEQMVDVVLRMKASGVAVLLSEQNLHFARLVADRAVIIEKGAVRFTGTFAALDAADDVTRETLAL